MRLDAPPAAHLGLKLSHVLASTLFQLLPDKSNLNKPSDADMIEFVFLMLQPPTMEFDLEPCSQAA